MSHVITRNSARLRATVTPENPSICDSDSASSSDEDEEGIPAVAPSSSKLQTGPYGTTLRPRPMPSKRFRDQEQDMDIAGRSKRQRIEDREKDMPGYAIRSRPLDSDESAKTTAAPQRHPAGNSTGYPTPNSSRTAQEVVDCTSKEGSESVDVGLLNVLNGVCGSRKRLHSPSQQLHSEAALDAEDEDPEISDLDIDQHEEVISLKADTDLGVDHEAIHNGDEFEASLGTVPTDAEEDEHAEDVRPEDSASNIEAQGPARERSTDKAPFVASEASPDRESKREVPVTGQVSSAEDGHRTPNADHAWEVAPSRIASPAGDGVSSPVLGFGAIQQPRGPKPQEQEDANNSQYAEEAPEDPADLEDPDIPPSPQAQAGSPDKGTSEEPSLESDDDPDEADAGADVEACFAEDLRRFRSKRVEYEDDSAFFVAPAGDPSTTIHVSPTEYSKAHRLINRLGWSAIRNDWEAKLLATHEPSTPPGRLMVHNLTKLERFCLMTPSAPRIVEQNRFLNEHGDLLGYYFIMIDRCVDRIRSQRLSFTVPVPSSPLNDNRGKRKKMTVDLVRLVIPLLVCVLDKAWALGGDVSDSAFTDHTVKLLTKLVGWIQKLYQPLMQELGIHPFESKPDKVAARAQWKRDNKAREDLGPCLARLQDILHEAPGELQKEEDAQIRVQVRRRQLLRKQEDTKIERELEVAAREKAQKQRNRNVARAIRLQASRLNTRASSRADNWDPSGVRSTTHWRTEEERVLFRRLQLAFVHDPPQLPDLDDTVKKIGHNAQETKEKSRDLLSRMYPKAYPQMTGREVQTKVHGLMRQWR
ncbi:hypothetical protein BJ170DRAFT_590846 [Xylariales sp. AK1849]|nr:hypothetical protein BJ170DRAFT_590846 [Xylariales sp. AK1849]